MPHPPPFRAAMAAVSATTVALLLALLPLLWAPASAAEEVDDPLRVTLTTITPVLPRSGTISISGTVTNTTDADFTRVNLLPFRSESPISDAQSLAASTVIPAHAYVGPRVAEAGSFATVDVLAPGATAEFSLEVPVSQLGIGEVPGVYWIGVHALGDSLTPRDEFAEGRARTFIPVLPGGRNPGTLEAAVILPLRNAVWHEPDGSVAHTDRWLRTLSDGGRLHTLLEIAEAGSGTNFTWLVDPAVLQAVARLGGGNAPRHLQPDPTVPGQEQPSEPTPEASAEPEATEALGDSVADPTQVSEVARAWLTRFLATTAGRDILTLPFGDLDVAAAVRQAPDLVEQAQARGATIMAQLSLTSTPAFVPTTGVLPAGALEAAADGTLIVLGDNAFAAPPDSPHSLARMLGHKVVVASTGAAQGGPGPGTADSPLALRQRLLSEAALRIINGDTAPVVLTLPTRWSTDDASALFSAFEEDWLTSVSVSSLAERSATGVPRAALAYTDADARAELGPGTFAAATRLDEAATLVEDVLTLQSTIEVQVGDESLGTLSQLHRGHPRRAARSAVQAREHLVDQLRQIRIEAPTAVTLSSDSGALGTTLINDLDQPVTVVVQSVTGDGLTLTDPGVRQLAAGSRTLVRFEASATRPGVHDVRFVVTSQDGTRLGSTARLPIRAAQVSGLIWVIMASGAALLSGAVGVRLWRQIRARRREREAEQ